jgi:hypothetical protein
MNEPEKPQVAGRRHHLVADAKVRIEVTAGRAALQQLRHRLLAVRNNPLSPGQLALALAMNLPGLVLVIEEVEVASLQEQPPDEEPEQSLCVGRNYHSKL